VADRMIKVAAGRHARLDAPVTVPAAGLEPGAPVAVAGPDGARLPAQVVECCGEALLAFLLPKAARGEVLEYRLLPGESAGGPGVEVSPGGADRLEVKVGGELFTAYNYSRELYRPNFYPVRMGGTHITRDYPMGQGPEGESTDHIHHRSLYVAHGDVNGVDNWGEGKSAGRTWHERFDCVFGGPVLGGLCSTNAWVDAEGRKVVTERRWATFWYQPGSGRLLDLRVEFEATEGPVTFGDTKEGGMVSVRLATSMDGKHGGTIRNAYGGLAEAETWGKRAEWVDYYGQVAGRTYGISVYEHPSSFRYPTYWHVRDYGLFAANPFALRDYYNDKSVDGSHQVPAGGKLSFRYRLYFHPGDTDEAGVPERYHDLINPPQAELG